MEERTGNGILEDFRSEFVDCWQRLPNKGFFLALLTAWLALFQFLGNSTLGYFHTPSLLRWTYEVLSGPGHRYLEAEESYGLLIPFVVLGLFWTKRRQLLALDHRTWWPALFLVIFGLLLHVFGYVIQQPRISILGLLAGLYGLTGLAWGAGWLRASFFPFFLLIFCIPLSPLLEIITFPLQLLVTRAVELICHLVLAIDVIREGTLLRDPTGRYQYEVAAACSGIRSLMAVVALAVILGFFSVTKWWRRVAMVVAAFPLAFLGNVLRMLAIVIAAEMWGQAAGNTVHDGGPMGIFSLIPYVPAFLGLFWLERFLRKRFAEPPASPKGGAGV